VHRVNKEHKYYLHKPTAILSCFQESTYYDGINIFINLTTDFKRVMNEKAQFKMALN
jgi:hypothetical protein